jgi:molybdopterin-containing oxidoreductase family membrane subunit
MVLQLMIPARAIFKLDRVITKNHLDNMAKMLLVTGWVVVYTYLVEPFLAWYSGNPFDQYVALSYRPFGTYWFVYWGVIFCNCIAVQALWSKRWRTTPALLFLVSCFIQLGMWSERFLLIVTSQARDFLPSSWRDYVPSWVDWTILGGTCCFFLFLFLLFLRVVPFIPIWELKELHRELERSESREHAERVVRIA